MRFARQRFKRLGDFLSSGFDVDRGRVEIFAVAVAGVGVGDGRGDVAFDPGEGGVAYPVDADLLGGDPGQVCAEALKEVVVAAAADGAAVAVAQQQSVRAAV